MLAFIKVHGVYVGFWLLMLAVGLVGTYWSVRWAVEHAMRNGGIR